MDRPLVSIIIAAYRPNLAHLTAAIASAIGQTWSKLEILVSDDSPDEAARALVECSADPRVEYVHHAPPRGAAGNHWWCLDRAKGEFVAILNHDDLFAPRFVEVLATALLHDPSASVAFCDHWIADADGNQCVSETETNSRVWGRSGLAPGLHRPFFSLLAAQTIPLAMGAVFRKSHLPHRLPPDAGPAYDLWLAYLLARGGEGAHYIPERLSTWRKHDGNLTSQGGEEWLGGAAACWAAVAADPACASIRGVANAKAARGFAAMSFKALTAGRTVDASRFARRSVGTRVSPRGLAAWALARLPANIAAPLLAMSRPCRRWPT